jgi:hypothetical protein
MSGLARFVAPILEILQVKLEIFVEIRFDSLFELRLVVLDANHEIAIPFDDVMSALFLAARGIDRGQRVGKLDPLQELENRRDFVRFLFGRDLAQGDPLLAGPGSDDVQRTQLLLRVVLSSTRFADDGNQSVRTAVVVPNGVGDPVLEALLKGLGLERQQQPTDTVARGNSVGKRQELLQPMLAILGPAMDGRRTIAAT